MITFGTISTGLLLVALGVLGLRYTLQIMNFTGSQDWIESKIGSGSTLGAYKVFALLVVTLGLLETTGLLHGVLSWILTPLRSLFPQG